MEDLGIRRVRAARNQSLFREVNEQMNRLDRSPGWPEMTTFVCECLDAHCAETIPVEIDAYERVRRYSERFFVLPDHYDPAVETVVEKDLRYWVVEKTGIGGEIAAAIDPRRRSA
jgi:hypothetical protein